MAQEDPLGAPLTTVLGSKTAKLFDDKWGYTTVGDLLRHFPRRYARLDTPTPISQLSAGDHATLLLRIVRAQARPMRNRPGEIATVVATDGREEIELVFFFKGRGKGAWWANTVMSPGSIKLFDGKPDFHGRGQYRRLQLTHPRLIDIDAELGDDVPAVLAIYPATAKLNTLAIRRSVRTALAWVGAGDPPPDPLPAGLREAENLPGLQDAFEWVHDPPSPQERDRALQRFTFEEAFALQTVLAQRRAVAATEPAVARRGAPGGLLDAFDARLPFSLTTGQRDVGGEIAADLARETPMMRLLQGDVGAGKTLVALRAMLTVVDSGGQAALMAPTEVLAQQHASSLRAMMGELAQAPLSVLGTDVREGAQTRVVLLTGSMRAAERRAALSEVASGAAGIVVGTHALFSETVDFADLGLVVVDEQHRFGVEQREALRDKASVAPHLLVMTATPIPRTVAMTVFGDLATSTLRELPAGRQPVASHVVPASREDWMARMWTRLREEVDAGRQAFVVAPRIGEDPAADAPAADAPAADAAAAPGDAEEVPDALSEDEAGSEDQRVLVGVLELLQELRSRPELAGLRVEMVHGRQPASEREQTMAAFAAGDVQVLVSTTVIEVGVNVPNASVMVVLDADRFGVSQLHQLRGRIGRGSDPGVCFLVDGGESLQARERLERVAATPDGFQVAEIDLETRREGDVLGTAQSGRRSSLRMLRVMRDAGVIERARAAAQRIVADDPELEGELGLQRLVAAFVGDEHAAFLEKS